MGIFNRMGKMVEAKFNEALDNAENPVELCNQRIRDMEEQFRKAELSSATVIGNAEHVKKDMEGALAESGEWDRKIRLAISKGDDELAKKAIARKGEIDQKAAGFKTAYETAHAQAEKLKETLLSLKEEIESTRQKRDELEARYKTAEASQAVNEIVAGVSSKKNSINMDDMERRVAKKEAMAEGLGEIASIKNDSLEDEFKKLDTVDTDSELAKYKAEMGK